MTISLRDRRRFWLRVQQADATGCWVWVGGTRENGYGSFAVKTPSGKWTQTTAHRWAYLSEVGDIPDGWEVDHLCKVRNCVRPDHLEAVTLQENRRRRDTGLKGVFDTATKELPVLPPLPPKRKRRDPSVECRNGHLYAEVGWAKNGKNTRTCRACLDLWLESKRTYDGHGTETHCPQGHPYSEENTDHRVRADGSKSRECKICRRARNNAYKARKRAERAALKK